MPRVIQHVECEDCGKSMTLYEYAFTHECEGSE